MNNRVYLFYNGDEAKFPVNNDWEKFTGHDSVRTFLTCAHSWQRQGWLVVRLTSEFTGPDPFHERGRIAQQYEWYPKRFWMLWGSLKMMADNAVDKTEPLHLLTYDVFNYKFTPGDASVAFGKANGDPGCLSYQYRQFSLSFVSLTPEWIYSAIRVLQRYDSGELAEIRGKYISDERILREYASYSLADLQCFSNALDVSEYPLVHYARSSLRSAYNDVPVFFTKL